MSPRLRGKQLAFVLLASSMAIVCLPLADGWAAQFGRVSGSVQDSHGNPLMGASVLLSGPLVLTSSKVGVTMERVITDAHGKFAIDHLLPGWYSLQITSPARVPILRNGIRVEAGETATEKFVLLDIFTPMRLQLPKSSVTNWGDDWKWVLRTSATTRPILRYQQEVAQTAPPAKMAPTPSQRLIGMMPGPAGNDPLSSDSGLGSVLAYLRPLSDDADLLVAGSMAPGGIQSSSVATSFRKNIIRGDPQELSLVVHQLSFADGAPIPSGDSTDAFARAQGAVASYTRTQHLSPTLLLTTGMEIDYLNAIQDAISMQPRLKLQYAMNSNTLVAVQYGAGRPEDSNTLMERVGMLNAFPRVTLKNYRPALEQLNHSEVSIHRRLNKSSRMQVAAYHDGLRNAAVWGVGPSSGQSWVAGYTLPNPAGVNGVILNAGDFQSSGVRAAFIQNFGSHVEGLVAYATGNALASPGTPGAALQQTGLRDYLRPARTDSIVGRVSASIPVTHTQFATSYGWCQRDRVTAVDPYGQASLQAQPYLGFQIHQPLPTFAFLPAHIEALADFRNLLAQGYVPLAQAAGETPLLLSSAYRSFRGGFSVQF